MKLIRMFLFSNTFAQTELLIITTPVMWLDITGSKSILEVNVLEARKKGQQHKDLSNSGRVKTVMKRGPSQSTHQKHQVLHGVFLVCEGQPVKETHRTNCLNV